MGIRQCISRWFALFTTGSWALSLLIIVYIIRQGPPMLLPASFLVVQHSPPIPLACGQYHRIRVLISVTSTTDVRQTFKTVSSLLTSSHDEGNLRVAIHIPYRLREQQSQIALFYRDQIEIGLISVHLNPAEPWQASSLSYTNTNWLHRQRTLDFAFAAQIGADRSQLFLPLAAGYVVNTAHLVHDLVAAVDEAHALRWATIDFLQNSRESAPAFSGRLFNSTELMRIAVSLKAYRAARPAEQILDEIISTLMIAAVVVDKTDSNLFIAGSQASDDLYQNMEANLSGQRDQVFEQEWDCLPDLPMRNISASANQYRFAFAIPTAYRPIKKNLFLVPLLEQLFNQIAVAEPNSVVTLMFMTGGEWESQLRSELQARFESYIAKQQLRLFSAPTETYPTLEGLRENYGDSSDRVKWRSKQNLDYASLIEATRDLADYMIMMEDDVKLANDFVQQAKNIVSEQSSLVPDWTMIDLCSNIGFAGKVFHKHTLWGLEVLMWTFYDELPCDWTVFASIRLESGYIYTLPQVLMEHRGNGSSTLQEKNVP